MAQVPSPLPLPHLPHRSGFVLELPHDYAAARALTAALRTDGWLDAATSAVWVEFILYNPNIHRFCVGRLLFERHAPGPHMVHYPHRAPPTRCTADLVRHVWHRHESGHIEPSATVRTLDLLPYHRENWVRV